MELPNLRGSGRKRRDDREAKMEAKKEAQAS